MSTKLKIFFIIAKRRKVNLNIMKAYSLSKFKLNFF